MASIKPLQDIVRSYTVADKDIKKKEEKEATTEMRLLSRVHRDAADRYEDGSDEYLPGLSSASSSEEEEPYVRDYNNLY